MPYENLSEDELVYSFTDEEDFESNLAVGLPAPRSSPDITADDFNELGLFLSRSEIESHCKAREEMNGCYARYLTGVQNKEHHWKLAEIVGVQQTATNDFIVQLKIGLHTKNSTLDNLAEFGPTSKDVNIWKQHYREHRIELPTKTELQHRSRVRRGLTPKPPCGAFEILLNSPQDPDPAQTPTPPPQSPSPTPSPLKQAAGTMLNPFYPHDSPLRPCPAASPNTANPLAIESPNIFDPVPSTPPQKSLALPVLSPLSSLGDSPSPLLTPTASMSPTLCVDSDENDSPLLLPSRKRKRVGGLLPFSIAAASSQHVEHPTLSLVSDGDDLPPKKKKAGKSSTHFDEQDFDPNPRKRRLSVSLEDGISAPIPKRGRGRPRKQREPDRAENELEVEHLPPIPHPVPVKRGRGRAKKTRVPERSLSPSQIVGPSSTGVGLPVGDSKVTKEKKKKKKRPTPTADPSTSSSNRTSPRPSKVKKKRVNKKDQLDIILIPSTLKQQDFDVTSTTSPLPPLHETATLPTKGLFLLPSFKKDPADEAATPPETSSSSPATSVAGLSDGTYSTDVSPTQPDRKVSHPTHLPLKCGTVTSSDPSTERRPMVGASNSTSPSLASVAHGVFCPSELSNDPLFRVIAGVPIDSGVKVPEHKHSTPIQASRSLDSRSNTPNAPQNRTNLHTLGSGLPVAECNPHITEQTSSFHFTAATIPLSIHSSLNPPVHESVERVSPFGAGPSTGLGLTTVVLDPSTDRTPNVVEPDLTTFPVSKPPFLPPTEGQITRPRVESHATLTEPATGYMSKGAGTVSGSFPTDSQRQYSIPRREEPTRDPRRPRTITTSAATGSVVQGNGRHPDNPVHHDPWTIQSHAAPQNLNITAAHLPSQTPKQIGSSIRMIHEHDVVRQSDPMDTLVTEIIVPQDSEEMLPVSRPTLPPLQTSHPTTITSQPSHGVISTLLSYENAQPSSSQAAPIVTVPRPPTPPLPSSSRVALPEHPDTILDKRIKDLKAKLHTSSSSLLRRKNARKAQAISVVAGPNQMVLGKEQQDALGGGKFSEQREFLNIELDLTNF